MLNQFKNLSCYEEFEIQSTLIGISKIDVLKEIGHKIDNYYFFVSEDGIFNWFDLNGNHIKDPGILKVIKKDYIPKTITKCIIPDSVIRLDDCAFAYYKLLKEITIPDGVISIGYGIFSFCESLKEITIPDSITCIGFETFYNCKSLKSINITDSVTIIGVRAFAHCKSLKEITIPDSVTNIGECAFYSCDSLKEVVFKGKTLDEVKQMENYPFGIKDKSIFKFS